MADDRSGTHIFSLRQLFPWLDILRATNLAFNPGKILLGMFGAFILALTPHSVLTAPYHRLSSRIVAAHEVFAAPPDQARSILARHAATYVVICGPMAPSGLSEPALSASLWAKLQANSVPDWLDPVAETREGPFRAYRIRAKL